MEEEIYGATIENIDDWYKVLKWRSLPNFQTCHRHPTMIEFESEYYKTSEIDNLLKIILDFIKTSGSSNAQFMGKMGSGKTTFLHYLRRCMQEDNIILGKVHFSIIRAGRIPLVEYEEGLKILFVDVTFKRFYKYCGFKEAYDRIIEQDISYELKLLKLQNFYLDNDNDFKKKLIVVLDDLDTIHEFDDVKNITNSFKRICGSGDGVSKWVSIREQTFENYPQDIQEMFTFFQQPFTLPAVSLFDVVEKRIKSKNGPAAINPFSKELCKKVLKIKNGSIRDALGLLSTIHHHTKPPKNKQGEKFIQNWFQKSAISTMVKEHIIPNIHSSKYMILHDYPIAYDLLNIINKVHIKLHIFYIAKRIASNKRGDLFNGKYRLMDNQLNSVLNILIDNNLVVVDKKEENIRLTEASKLIIYFQQDTYTRICKYLAVAEELDVDDIYWENLKEKIRYDLYINDLSIHLKVKKLSSEL